MNEEKQKSTQLDALYDWAPEDLVEVSIAERDDFLKIRETLSRIGIASRTSKTLYQSCHILYLHGKYYIVHFKELFALDGRRASISVHDMVRRNTIIKLLEDWNLLRIRVPSKMIIQGENIPSSTFIKIVPYREKDDWVFETKFQLGSLGF